MILKSIEYVQYEGEPEEWNIKGFTLGAVNLLVGKNATGKSRSLNIINMLARLFSGDSKPTLISGTWKAAFEHEGDHQIYEVEFSDRKVRRESFTSKGKELLKRSDGGTGSIYAEKMGKSIDFQTPETELAVVARRDNIQHPFFELLHEWGEALYLYQFGTPLGKNKYAIISEDYGQDVNTKDAEQVVGVFRKGIKDYEEKFENAIKEDMGRIGYLIENVGLERPSSITITGPLGSKAVGLFVKEAALEGITDQCGMSQGMFRALSIIIQLNYSYLAGKPSCILIDDIGEGLDFERSSALIELLVEKAQSAKVQLVMTTNDRFVMNNVPLEMWSLLQREGGDSRVYNYENSKEKFDDFKFTGLNNFDFLAADFLNAESLPDA